jgi:hypothetical protein
MVLNPLVYWCGPISLKSLLHPTAATTINHSQLVSSGRSINQLRFGQSIDFVGRTFNPLGLLLFNSRRIPTTNVWLQRYH